MSKINEIFSKHGVDNSELIAAVNAEITNQIKNAGIPKDRFNAVYAEKSQLTADLAEMEVKLQEAQNKLEKATGTIDELSKYKVQIEDITKQKNQQNLQKWNEVKNVFEVKEGDKTFEKVNKIKGKFKFGEDLTPEQIEHNLDMYNTYDEIEFFKGAKEQTDYNAQKPDPDKKPPQGEFYGYDSVEQLAWKRPDLYEKYKKEKYE